MDTVQLLMQRSMPPCCRAACKDAGRQVKQLLVCHCKMQYRAHCRALQLLSGTCGADVKAASSNCVTL